MAAWGEVAVYISSAHWSSVTAWATGTATAGQVCRQSATPTVNNERVFVCTVGGAKGATEPTWNVNRGNTTTDGSATWMEATGLAPMNGDTTSGPTWNAVKGQSSSLGSCITDIAKTHVFICTTSGTSGSGAEPSWNVSAVGNTTTDGTTTWTYIGLASSFGKFACPHARIQNGLAGGWGDGNGSGVNPTKFYVGSDHAETQTSGFTWRSSGAQATPLDIICISVSGNIPPASSADLATTATVTTTSTGSMTLQSYIRWCYGITFSCGTSGGTTLTLNNEAQIDKCFESCNFQLGAGASGGAVIEPNANRTCGLLTLRNCTFKFSNTSQQLNNKAKAIFTNVTIDNTGSIPTTLMQPGDSGTDWLWRDSDLSNITGTFMSDSSNSSGRTQFQDCKMASSFTAASLTEQGNSQQISFSRCSSSALNIQFLYQDRYGTLTNDTTVVRTGGATENVTPFSWKCVNTSVAVGFSEYLKSPPIAQWNSKTGANVTVTVNGVVNAASLPTNLQTYIDIDYLGTSGNTLGAANTTRVVDGVTTPTALTADTASGWDTAAPARQNSHTYNVGDAISLASNPGRIFFCTASSGNTAASEPAGYASAVDGGSVTDGSATFRAGCRFKIVVTLSTPQPQIAGNIYVNVYFANPSTTTYVDPNFTLS